MSKRPLPASRIIIDGEALRELLREWGIDAERCQLWNAGVNDHYLVSSRGEAWMLRVYRKGWRSRPEIDWELGLLDHARAAGLPVAHAIAVGGELVHGISTVQGERDAVLFTYAPGKAAAFPPVDEYIDRYADLAGRLHDAGRSYVPKGDRDPLDLDHLVAEPIAALAPHLGHRPEDLEYVTDLGERISTAIEACSGDLEWGACHGDLHGGNAHDDGRVCTLFDFDCGGPGWIAYDVAVFLWSVQFNLKRTEPWDRFLAAYQTIRSLSEADHAAVPWFVLARAIWLAGFHAANIADWGLILMSDPFLDRSISFLRKYEKQVGLDA